MLRINSNSLSVGVPGPVRFKREVFSGLIYVMDEDQTLAVLLLIEDGRLTAISHDWIALPKGGTRIDADALESEDGYGPFYWRGEPFTGVAYSFGPEGHCVDEQVYLEGMAEYPAQRAWYLSGAPRFAAEGGTYMAWFEDGRLQAKGDAITNVHALRLLLAGDGILKGIELRERELFDFDTVAALQLTPEFFLIGPAIDNALIEELLRHPFFRTTPRLWLVETGADARIFDILGACTGLKTLSLRKNPALRADLDAQILQRLRDVTVEFS
ncbi:hypothetical protein [Duganella vulcania]|nr:hypothetical protein [Duganella vulcania]